MTAIQLETVVAVRRPHHRNLDALIGKSGDAVASVATRQVAK